MKILLSLALLAATWTVYAQGTTQAIVGYTNANSAFINSTVGWTFQPNTNVSVTDLGCFAKVFDDNQSVSSIEVGLWDSGGALLASNSVTATSPLVGETRYESITPVALLPNQVYNVGIFSPSGTIGIDVAGVAANGTIGVSPEITLRAAASSSPGSGFTFPAEDQQAFGSIYAGPNFEYQGRVPEPGSWVLLGLGGLFLVAGRANWRRQVPAC
jgi:Domain of unknown function (DUF4082)/PEP-CTERM motif